MGHWNSCQFFFLHGLSSSPGSRKGRFLRGKLARRGYPLGLPDLNKPTFETLTLTAQVQEMEQYLDALHPNQGMVLVGSSLGGLVSLILADRHPDKIARMVLLSPAIRFVGDRLATAMGSSLEQWREEGSIPVIHFSDNKLHRLGFQLVEDARTFGSSYLDVKVPTLIIHGTADELIPISSVERWALGQPMVQFRPVEGGNHDLGDYLEEIWNLSKRFIFEGCKKLEK